VRSIFFRHSCEGIRDGLDLDWDESRLVGGGRHRHVCVRDCLDDLGFEDGSDDGAGLGAV
jgi:hypothetical protein